MDSRTTSKHTDDGGLNRIHIGNEITLASEHLHEPVSKYVRTRFTRVYVDCTVERALSLLRTQLISDRIAYVYVTDHEDVLKGVLPLRQLIGSDPSVPVASIMITDLATVSIDSDVRAACEVFLDTRLLALPVVDESGRIAGVVDISLFADEAAELQTERELENVFQLIGVHLALGKKQSPLVAFRDRFPWLLFNVGSGIVCALIAARNELLIAEITILALFLTVVLALAESVSMQSMTLTLQALANQPFSWRLVGVTLGKELPSACMLGVGGGAVVGLVALAWRGEGEAALVIGLSILLSMITACLLGVGIPSVIRALRANPRVASGPIVLAITDIGTLVFYFSLAATVLAAR